MWAKMIPQPDEKSSYFRRKKIKIVHKKKKEITLAKYKARRIQLIAVDKF